MRVQDHLGNKKHSTSHKFCYLLSKIKINQIIKTQTLKTNGVQVIFVGSFLKQALIYLLQAVNHIKLPTFHCTLPRIWILSILLYYDIADAR